MPRLKVCVNGQRSRAEHAAVPVTPDEVAEAAAGAIAAGAEAVHVHPRGEDGAQSLLAEHIAAAVGAIRRRCPGIAVGVSTGLWISGGEPAVRLETVAGWARLPAAARPDFASVNLSEPGFQELSVALNSASIGVEAGVWSVADADAAARWQPPAGWLRILVEIVDAGPSVESAAMSTATDILTRLDSCGLTAPRLLHGEGPTCWLLIALAGQLGLPTRIGLEDTILGPHGEPVADNAELVALALQILDS